jgi:hypothetical protein
MTKKEMETPRQWQAKTNNVTIRLFVRPFSFVLLFPSSQEGKMQRECVIGVAEPLRLNISLSIFPS